MTRALIHREFHVVDFIQNSGLQQCAFDSTDSKGLTRVGGWLRQERTEMASFMGGGTQPAQVFSFLRPGVYAIICVMTRAEALVLLHEYTPSESLRRHALSVEAGMRFYANRCGADAEVWGVTGLLHDFDYERWPTIPEHTLEGAKILRARGVDEEIIGAILSHADWNRGEFPLDRPIRKTLFAVDELSGFVNAVAYVRPDKLGGMTPSSVRKKMKHASFAAAVKREDIEAGARLLELSLDDHIANVISALQGISNQLGF